LQTDGAGDHRGDGPGALEHIEALALALVGREHEPLMEEGQQRLPGWADLLSQECLPVGECLPHDVERMLHVGGIRAHRGFPLDGRQLGPEV
jgi:hypothetical protein